MSIIVFTPSRQLRRMMIHGSRRIHDCQFTDTHIQGINILAHLYLDEPFSRFCVDSFMTAVLMRRAAKLRPEGPSTSAPFAVVVSDETTKHHILDALLILNTMPRDVRNHLGVAYFMELLVNHEQILVDPTLTNSICDYLSSP